MQPHPTCLRFQGSVRPVEWAGLESFEPVSISFPPFAMKEKHETRILKSFELPPLAVDLFERSGELLIAIWDGDSSTPQEPTLVLCPCHARELAKAIENAAKAAKPCS
jgi:hypothetical protein